MLFGASFVSLGSVPIVTEGTSRARKTDSTKNVPKVLLKSEDLLDFSGFWQLYICRGKKIFLLGRRGRVLQKGSGSTELLHALKGWSSLCDPCNIKAHLPNPRQCSLSCPCIWQTSWVSAGRIQPLLCASKRTQRSGKCRARPSLCPALN